MKAAQAPGAPVVRSWPRKGWLELTFAEQPQDNADATVVLFTSPVWLDFSGTRLLSVDLLDTPEFLAEATRCVPSMCSDTGWLWISVSEGERPTRRWTGSSATEFVFVGPCLVSVRLDLDRGFTE